MNVLFVDHSFHRRTKSADFFLRILKSCFAVKTFYYDRCYQCGIPQGMVDWADLVVYWEFLPGRYKLAHEGKKCVFVPMYDNEWGSFWQWKRIAWSGMGVVSFCDKVTEHARCCGVTNILDVRYFPDPALLPQCPGDSKKVFLWKRGGITKSMVEAMFPSAAGYTFMVKGAQDFLPREQYLERLSSCGIVIAPRRKEGIGMAFLEAMAMGKCVVAYDDATMNEYIKHGETGVLFNSRELTAVDFSVVEHVRKNLSKFSVAQFVKWQKNAQTINDFLAKQPLCRPTFENRLKRVAAYPFYLAEGAVYRLAHG